jgi:type I restriction enzyme S subunit
MPRLDLSRLVLPAQHLKTLQALLTRHVPDAEVWAYGSRVTGGAHDGSDLDLVLRDPADPGAPIDGWLDLQDALRESTLPMLVDVHLWSHLPEDFRCNIEAGYVVLQGADDENCFQTDLPTASFMSLLSDIVDNRGRTCPTAEKGLPLIATNCVKNSTLYPVFEKVRYVNRETYNTWFRGHPEPGDIVFVCKGSPGQICMVPDPINFCIAQDMVAVRADPKKVYPPYLFAALRSATVQNSISNMHVGTLIPHFKKGDFDKLDIPLPAFHIQRFTGDIYLLLSRKIELNRRMNETLEAMARAIFKDWFVDFGPTRTKMEGGPPYLAPDIWSLFPDRLDDEGKPDGWGLGSIYEAVDVIYGAPFASAQFNSDQRGQPLIRIRDLINEKPGVWTPEIHPKGYKVKPGDIVVGMDGEFRAYLWGGEEAWLNQRVCVFAPKEGYSTAFVRNSIIAPLAYIEATETATTVIHLGKGDIDKFTAFLPSKAVLKTYNDICQPQYDRIVSNKLEMKTLTQTRDLLLPKLMSGEIRVRDAEKAATILT